MERTRTARIWLSAVLLTALLAIYGYWIMTETPSYWETFLFVTLLFVLYAAALIRFVPYFLTYFSKGTEPHLERVGDRTYRRCGVRELAKIVLLVLILRLLELLLTYLIRMRMFGFTETFFRVQRIWLDFYHAEYCFPAYPLLSNLFWFVTFNFNHARFVSAYILVALAAAAVYYWVLLDFDRPVARHATLYFLLMPAACLLLGTLPDGLFVLFSLLCLLFARRRRFVLANLFAMLSVMTHLMGVLLFVPCIIEFSQMLSVDMRAHSEEKHGFLLRRIVSALSFLLIPLGFGAVLLYSQSLYGNTTALFRAAMDAYGYRALLPLSSAAELCDRFLDALRMQEGEALYRSLGNTVPNLVYLLLGAVLLVAAPGKIRTSNIAYMLVTYGAVLCTGTLWELPRLLSLCVPFVLTLSLSIRPKWIHRILYLVFFAGFLLYLAAVVGGYTVYGALPVS